MAYGKNKSRKNWLMKAVPLAVGILTGSKRESLFQLRGDVLVLMQEMSTVGFCQEPLANNEDGQSLDAALLTVQKSNLDLNSVWREQARMRVKPALEECNNRYFAKLAGGLRFVDTLIPVVEGVKQTRIYYNIPESVQSIITKDEIAALKAIGEEGKAIELFSQVIINNDAGALSVAQVAVLTDIHAR